MSPPVVRLAALGASLAGAAPAPAAPDRVVAVAAALEQVGDRTRLTITMSGAVEPKARLFAGPDRAVVELPGLNCQIPPDPAGRRKLGLVAGLRCGSVSSGRTRLLLDLAAPATIARLSVEPGPFEPVTHLVVELARADPESFRRAAREASGDPEAPGAPGAGASAPPKPLVAIDAGHGGHDTGAVTATGQPEKDVTLAFARALRDQLLESGRVRVVLIRDADVFVPLDERVRLARVAGADLFVSVHGDSMTNPFVRGATIYTGAERATDVESARLADRENAADGAGHAVPPESRAGVSDILQDLTIRETRGLSTRFAGLLHADLGRVTRFTIQPHREAGFRVLRAPDMASALVELGYMSNRDDADLLLSDDWRRRTAAAMGGAIERFFGARLAGRAVVSP